MATQVYRNEKLEEATIKLSEAKEMLAIAKTEKDVQCACDEIEFWLNKKSYLSHAKI